MSEQLNADMFDKDLKEDVVYSSATPDADVLLPVTQMGFEALLREACLRHAFLPSPNDSLRAVLAGYIHHIPNERSTITLKEIITVLHKSIANLTSWRIDQGIKQKAREATIAAQQEALKAAEEAVPLPRRVRRARARHLKAAVNVEAK